MDYQETLRYYREIAGRGIVPGLEKIRALVHALGDPQKKVPVVHIAGTNGKGSVGAMLASVLAAAGKTVGRFVSPAVFGEREILQIYQPGEGAGHWITEEDYAEVTTRVREADEANEIGATPFEVQTAAAFLYFAGSNCDLALIECGMGGRLDATNVIEEPVLCVITSISRDHMKFLGDTLEEIAGEKAGIIKEGVPVVTVTQKKEAADVIRRRCLKTHSPYKVAVRADIREIRTEVHEDGLFTQMTYRGETYELALAGVHQTENAALTIEASRFLGIPGEAVHAGLARAVWPGRLELVRTSPIVLLDGAHNVDAAARLVQNIRRYFPGKKVLLCMGAFRDKEVAKELDVLSKVSREMIAFSTQTDRSLPEDQLAAYAKSSGIHVRRGISPDYAIRLAMRTSKPDDVIVCCGSLSFLGKVRQEVLAWDERR